MLFCLDSLPYLNSAHGNLLAKLASQHCARLIHVPFPEGTSAPCWQDHQQRIVLTGWSAGSFPGSFSAKWLHKLPCRAWHAVGEEYLGTGTLWENGYRWATPAPALHSWSMPTPSSHRSPHANPAHGNTAPAMLLFSVLVDDLSHLQLSWSLCIHACQVCFHDGCFVASLTECPNIFGMFNFRFFPEKNLPAYLLSAQLASAAST